MIIRGYLPVFPKRLFVSKLRGFEKRCKHFENEYNMIWWGMKNV